MCGIVGVVNATHSFKTADLNQSIESLGHRGPDGQGSIWSEDKRVGFGHTRLAIIELSDLGKQPMRCRTTGNFITFNGEIYNFEALKSELIALGFEFCSNSDTEVLLHGYAAWGTSVLERVSGMFAFAIFDKPNNRVFIGRDRAGEKPLFYSQEAGGTLAFASEIKALLPLGRLERRIDHSELTNYLIHGYTSSTKALVRGIKKLPPAHFMQVDLGSPNISVCRYWDLPSPPKNAVLSFVDASNRLEAILKASVARQCVSDVPLGVLLSGGLDSSIIAILAAQSLSGLRTFTASFPSNNSFDESSYAKQIANFIGSSHTVIESDDPSIDNILEIASHIDEPIADTSLLPTYLLMKAVGTSCKVALGGDGADELFGGYPQYNKLSTIEEWGRWIPISMRSQFFPRLADKFEDASGISRWLRIAAADLSHQLPNTMGYFSAREIAQHLSGFVSGPAAEHDQAYGLRGPAHSLLSDAMRADFQRFLPDDVLVKGDRTSMAASLEVRAPFLDKEVIEFAFGEVPDNFKANKRHRKILLRDVGRRILPPGFDVERKQGFVPPLHKMIAKPRFAELFNDALLNSKESPLYDLAHKVWYKEKRSSNNARRIFSLLVFEIWRRRYSVGWL